MTAAPITPSPWFVSGVRAKVTALGGYHDSHVIKGGPEEEPVAVVFYSDKVFRGVNLHPETFANAQAIAAVPDMIAALQFYAKNWQPNGDGDLETPGLSKTWMEPTDDLNNDEGQKAVEALRKAGQL